MTLAAILLAAGHSRRFGAQNKLLAPFRGRPLICHAADTLRSVGADRLIAVTRSDAVADLLSGFEIVRPETSDPRQSDSLRAGMEAAESGGAERVIIALGDMPCVTEPLLHDLLGRVTDASPSAASDGRVIMPPVCLPKSWFSRIRALAGDRGAGSLLQKLPASQLAVTESRILSDIDTPDDVISLG